MVNAAAIATLAGLAPGRVAVALGAGFTGRFTLGQPPMRWADVAEYVTVLRSLLRGEETTWQGAAIRMLHPSGFAPPRPLADIPILLGADGPKGHAVARELGDGVVAAAIPPGPDADLPTWRALLAFGTVMADGEEPSSPRVVAAAGHGLAVGYHAVYERAGAGAVDQMPGGRTWREAIERVPDHSRHLAIHEDHLVAVTERDRPAVMEGIDLLPRRTFSGTGPDLRTRVEGLAAAGITEIIYQPAGPDVPGELERFHHAVA
jgi:5,10-methylenetetrahydromethanopterin reductase